MHTSQFIHLHGNIVSFTQQGLEKLNDVTTKYFQRSTNHHDLSSLRQILEKEIASKYYKKMDMSGK